MGGGWFGVGGVGCWSGGGARKPERQARTLKKPKAGLAVPHHPLMARQLIMPAHWVQHFAIAHLSFVGFGDVGFGAISAVKRRTPSTSPNPRPAGTITPHRAPESNFWCLGNRSAVDVSFLVLRFTILLCLVETLPLKSFLERHARIESIRVIILQVLLETSPLSCAACRKLALQLLIVCILMP